MQALSEGQTSLIINNKRSAAISAAHSSDLRGDGPSSVLRPEASTEGKPRDVC